MQAPSEEAAVGNGSWFGLACASEPALPGGPISSLIIPWAGRCTWSRSCPRRPPSPTSASLGLCPWALRQAHHDCRRLCLSAARSHRTRRRRRRRVFRGPSSATRDSDLHDPKPGLTRARTEPSGPSGKRSNCRGGSHGVAGTVQSLGDSSYRPLHSRQG